MTFIQPNTRPNTLNVAIMALVFSTVFAMFVLVAVYNGVVNVSHNIAAVKAELDTVGAESTSLQNTIVARMGSGAVADAARTAGLIEDVSPQYLSADARPSLSLVTQ